MKPNRNADRRKYFWASPGHNVPAIGRCSKISGISVQALMTILLLCSCTGLQEEPATPSACIEDTCFTVEVADTAAMHALGLMYRGRLEPDKGMLFVFDKEEVHGFWMKNTLIPLDIIWMDSEGEVLFIKENAQPCGSEECLATRPAVNALYVLEINAGKAKESGIDVGDRMELRY